MKRRSPLSSLEDLRERARDAQREALAETIRAAQLAAAKARESERTYAGAAAEVDAARRAEALKLGERGLTAADGQRLLAWERAAKQRLSALAAQAESSARGAKAASVAQAHAAERLGALDAELKRVQDQIEQRAREARRRDENRRQDALDDLSLHRFFHSKSPR